MAAQLNAKALAAALTALAIITLLVLWGISGFRVNTADYRGYPPLKTAQQKYGCYENSNLKVVISEKGLTIPGSEVIFSKSVLADDKHGELIYFEPAINVVKDSVGNWQVYRDDKNQMISKIYFHSSASGEGLKVPWLTDEGIILPKVSTC